MAVVAVTVKAAAADADAEIAAGAAMAMAAAAAAAAAEAGLPRVARAARPPTGGRSSDHHRTIKNVLKLRRR